MVADDGDRARTARVLRRKKLSKLASRRLRLVRCMRRAVRIHKTLEKVERGGPSTSAACVRRDVIMGASSGVGMLMNRGVCFSNA